MLRRTIQLSLWLLFTLASGAAVTAAGVYLYLSPNLPDVDELYEVKLQIPLRIYTSDGELIGEFGEKRRTPIKYAQMPKSFVQAVLAAEDSNFFEHSGISISGLIRATTELILTGEKQTGGSTVTMQVARNFFLTRDQTFKRKFVEILLALEIDRKLEKEQIFELYANKIFWGNRAYGAEAAARVYYGESIENLTLAQHAMIAGLPKAPSTFNPIVNPTRALTRRNWILGRMLMLGYINKSEHDVAREMPVTASLHGAEIDVDAPYAAEMARLDVLKMFGREAYDRGLSVYTTIRADRQHAATYAVRKGILDYEQRHGYRGPEQNTFDENEPEANREAWNSILKKTRKVGDLLPAIVTAVNEDSVEILLADDAIGIIAFDDGIKQAREFINENTLGKEIEKPLDVCKVGDLIRVYPITKPEKEKEKVDLKSEPGEEAVADSNTDDQLPADIIAGHFYFSQLPEAQASLVSLDPLDGSVQAVVGGYDFNSSKFNRVTQSERQPGSNFKPFIYAAALNEGFTAASLFNDAPVVMADAELENSWRPTNASGKFYGPTRLRKALYLSRNLVSVRLLRTITPATAIDFVESFGFDAEKLPKDLSLSLGSHAVTPLQVARGYAAFANGGQLINPYIVDRVESGDGQILYKANPLLARCSDCETEADDVELGDGQPNAQVAVEAGADTDEGMDVGAELEPELTATPLDEKGVRAALFDPNAPRISAPRAVDPHIAFIIDDILRDVVRRGTATKAKSLERSDLAGKTGTTNGPIDAWFSGYNPNLVTTVWLGFDQNRQLGRREFGGSAALPIWMDYMKVALADQENVPRSVPEGIVSMRIDPKTGLLASPLQDDGIFEYFRVGNAPVERAPDPESFFNPDVDFSSDPFAADESVDSDASVEGPAAEPAARPSTRDQGRQSEDSAIEDLF